MATNVLLIGGAGTGKTTALMDIIDKLLAAKLSPWEIGFCSFTRAARQTAVERAAIRFDISPKKLQDEGWFRTLHSICYRVLGLTKEQTLTKGKEAKEWFKQWFDEELDVDDDDRGGASFLDSNPSDLTLTLNLWSTCRQRLEMFCDTHAKAETSGAMLPAFDRCVELINRYEECKKLDGKSDYTDWLGQFAGICFDPVEHSNVQPRGDVPVLEAWLLDEQQDNSALMDRCFRRLVEPARWAYVCGDPMQSLFGFNGSDPHLFQAWTFQKQRILDKSFRCLSVPLAKGEDCLRTTSDYWDRGIKPAGEGGEFNVGRFGDGMDELEASDETWLLLARTNYFAGRFVTLLRNRGVPYVRTRGGSEWFAPKRNGAFYSLLMLQHGNSIFEPAWADVLELKGLPVKFREQEMLVRGTKMEWKKRDTNPEELSSLDNLHFWGATPALCDLIRSGMWAEFFEFAPTFVAAIEKFGVAACFEPRVTVSTVHSAKGMESDNVIILDSVGQIVHNASQEQSVFDEECRIAYVACTRARRGLWVVSDHRAKYRMEIPT